MRRLICSVLITMLLFAADRDLRDMFQRARLLGAQNRNLNEAIRLYGNVVQFGQGERALAARAQYEQGLLFERLGRREDARVAFEAVVRHFPEQRVAALAQARLPARPDTGITVRQVWTDVYGVVVASPSPDGRLLSFTESSGELAVHDVASGTNRRVSAERYTTNSLFSADGGQIAYVLDRRERSPQIRTIPVEGGSARVVYEDNSPEAFLHLFDWSSSGDHLCVLRIVGGNRPEMMFVSTRSGSHQVFAAAPGWQGQRALFSPDGRYIAYNVIHSTAEPGTDIAISSTDGAKTAIAVRHRADDHLIGWSPDGSALVFTSDRSGTKDLWSIPVFDGNAAGEVILIKREIPDIEPLGLTRTGTLFYTTLTRSSEVLTSALDLRHLSAGELQAVSDRFAGTKLSPLWSPDGKKLAYLVSTDQERHAIRLHDMSSGDEITLRPDVVSINMIQSWSRDGRYLFGMVQGRNQWGLAKIDIETGEYRMVMDRPPDRPAVSPDGRSLYFRRDINTLVRRDAETGAEEILYRSGPRGGLGNPRCRVSPDGNTVAFLMRDMPWTFSSIAIVPSRGGPARILFTIHEPERFGVESLAWTPDQTALLVARCYGENRSEIWKIPIDGSPPTPIGIAVPTSVNHVRLTDDGRRIAILAVTRHDDVWTMDHFLPAARQSRGERVASKRR